MLIPILRLGTAKVVLDDIDNFEHITSYGAVEFWYKKPKPGRQDLFVKKMANGDYLEIDSGEAIKALFDGIVDQTTREIVLKKFFQFKDYWV